MNAKHEERATSFFAQPGILAGKQWITLSYLVNNLYPGVEYCIYWRSQSYFLIVLKMQVNTIFNHSILATNISTGVKEAITIGVSLLPLTVSYKLTFGKRKKAILCSWKPHLSVWFSEMWT